MSPRPNTHAAQEQLRRALAHIQDAQGSLDRACAEMSSVRGCLRLWGTAGRLADRVKEFWYRVDRARMRPRGMRLDSEPEEGT